MAAASEHVPVLAQECLEALGPQPGQIMVDGTLGGGGHARLLAERVGRTGRVIALDRDPAAIERGRQSLAGLPVEFDCENFANLPEVLRQLDVDQVDGILLDLGMSSDQLADEERGFSFNSPGPLDLRFNPLRGEPAWRLLERLSAAHLADLLFQLGQERFSRRIARRVVQRREQQGPIDTSRQLAELVRSCMPGRRGRQRIDPATRTFQALRIAVNDELRWLETALRRLPECLRAGGLLAVISFHSLEDRLVKSAFRQDPRFEIITRKPIRAGAAELDRNPRSRSARLRVARRADS